MWIYVGKILDKNNIQKKFIFVNSDNGSEQIINKQSIHKFCTENEVINLRVDKNKTLSGKNMYLNAIPSYKEFPDGIVRQVGGTSKQQVIDMCMPFIVNKINKENYKNSKDEYKKAKDMEDKLFYLISKLKCINDLLEFTIQMKDTTNVMDILSGISRYTRQLDIDNAEYKLEDIVRKYGVPGIVRAVDDKLNRLHKRAVEQNIEKESLQKFNINNTISGMVYILRNKNKALQEAHGQTKEIIKNNKQIKEKEKEACKAQEIEIISEDEITPDMIEIEPEIEVISEDEITPDMIEIEPEIEFEMTFREYDDTMRKLVKECREKFKTDYAKLIVYRYIGSNKKPLLMLSWRGREVSGIQHIKVSYKCGDGSIKILEKPEPKQFIDFIFKEEVNNINIEIIQSNKKYKEKLESILDEYSKELGYIQETLSKSCVYKDENYCRQAFSNLKADICDLYFEYIDGTDIAHPGFETEYDKDGLLPLNLLMLIEKQLTSMLDDTPLHMYDYITVICDRSIEYSSAYLNTNAFKLGLNYVVEIFMRIFSKYSTMLPECFINIVDRACDHFIEDDNLNSVGLVRSYKAGLNVESRRRDIITGVTDRLRDAAREIVSDTDINNETNIIEPEKYNELKEQEEYLVSNIKKTEKILMYMRLYGLELSIKEYEGVIKF